MARHVVDFQVNRPDEEIRQIVTDYMSRAGFNYTTYKNEQLWKKGVGMMAAPQFMKVNFQNGQVHIEAWLKYVILPGVYVGEMGVKGFWGWAIKKVLKERVEMLVSILTKPAPPQA